MAINNGDTPELKRLTSICKHNSTIESRLFSDYKVYRGLRAPDGRGVLTGLTEISDVMVNTEQDGKFVPCAGELYYRGYNVKDLVADIIGKERFGFEEVIYLLLFGKLPDETDLASFKYMLGSYRRLPSAFFRDIIMKSPSVDLMNSMARSVLTLYSYDSAADDLSLTNVLNQCLYLIATYPMLAVYSYQAYAYYKSDSNSFFIHDPDPTLSTAENILHMLRIDSRYTNLEARVLDLALILHAEHGGGNNSTFTTRVLSSAQTDIYSTIAAAIGSLKGFRHGGANHKVRQMMTDIMQNVQHWDSDDEVENYLERILRREVGDKSGLIYGIGHAIYTLSDPRAVELKKQARSLAAKTGYADQFALYERIERLAPDAFHKVTGNEKVVCANVDFYSGLVYEMLGIPEDLYTPMFAVSRISGWCAHRIEELTTGGRIIRPAYRALPTGQTYIPLKDRHYDTKSVL